MSEPAISAKQVTVTLDGKTVLDALDFTIASGRITGLLGPSGSGKTTLMRSIVGTQHIHGGTLQVLGKPAGSPALRPRIGYVTQAPAVYGDLTVLQNLEYFAVMTGAPASAARQALAQVDLQAQSSQLVDSLSGGQKARVSLGVALVGDAELLVLDEPTVGLDPLLRRRLWELFTNLAREGRTLVVSSHVMDEAARCDDLLLIREGHVLSQGSLQELLRRTKAPDVEQAFITLVKDAS
jgi:ABC-2 type transport system ATP-binding protein